MLTEIIEQRLRNIAHYRQWSVITHRINRFFGISHHWCNDFLYFFFVIIKCLKQTHIIIHIIINFFPAVNLVKFYSVFCQPITIGEFIRQILFQQCIIVDFSFLHIHHEHFAGTKSTFFFHFRCFKRQDSHFRCYDHRIIICNKVSCRAQAIAVEHSTGIASVAEEQSCRTVPCFHKNTMILIECFQFGRNRVLIVE